MWYTLNVDRGVRSVNVRNMTHAVMMPNVSEMLMLETWHTVLMTEYQKC